MAKKMGHFEKVFTSIKAQRQGGAGKKKKTGPISAGGVAELKSPTRGGGGGFLNFKKMFGSM